MGHASNPLKYAVYWCGGHFSRHPGVLTAVSTVLVALGGALIGKGLTAPGGEFAWKWILLGILAAFVGVIPEIMVISWRARSEQDDIQATVQERRLLLRVLSPIIQELATLPAQDKPTRRESLTSMQTRVAGGVENIFQHRVSDVRVSIFDCTVNPDRLQCVEHFGRQPKPNDFTRENDPEIFQIFDSRKHFKYDSSEKKDFLGKKREYGSYISAPIRNNGNNYGMMTIDAPDDASLDSDDGPVVASLAAALGVAYAEVFRKSSP